MNNYQAPSPGPMFSPMTHQSNTDMSPLSAQRSGIYIKYITFKNAFIINLLYL